MRFTPDDAEALHLTTQKPAHERTKLSRTVSSAAPPSLLQRRKKLRMSLSYCARGAGGAGGAGARQGQAEQGWEGSARVSFVSVITNRVGKKSQKMGRGVARVAGR